MVIYHLLGFSISHVKRNGPLTAGSKHIVGINPFRRVSWCLFHVMHFGLFVMILILFCNFLTWRNSNLYRVPVGIFLTFDVVPKFRRTYSYTDSGQQMDISTTILVLPVVFWRFSSKRILFPLDLWVPAMVRHWPVSALLAAKKSLLVVRREEKSGLIAAGGSEDGSNSSWDFVSHL